MELNELFIFPRRKMAKHLNTSPTTVWRRIQKMRQQKQIVGYYSKGRAMIYEKGKIGGGMNGYKI